MDNTQTNQATITHTTHTWETDHTATRYNRTIGVVTFNVPLTEKELEYAVLLQRVCFRELVQVAVAMDKFRCSFSNAVVVVRRGLL